MTSVWGDSIERARQLPRRVKGKKRFGKKRTRLAGKAAPVASRGGNLVQTPSAPRERPRAAGRSAVPEIRRRAEVGDPAAAGRSTRRGTCRMEAGRGGAIATDRARAEAARVRASRAVGEGKRAADVPRREELHERGLAGFENLRVEVLSGEVDGAGVGAEDQAHEDHGDEGNLHDVRDLRRVIASGEGVSGGNRRRLDRIARRRNATRRPDDRAARGRRSRGRGAPPTRLSRAARGMKTSARGGGRAYRTRWLVRRSVTTEHAGSERESFRSLPRASEGVTKSSQSAGRTAAGFGREPMTKSVRLPSDGATGATGGMAREARIGGLTDSNPGSADLDAAR